MQGVEWCGSPARSTEGPELAWGRVPLFSFFFIFFIFSVRAGELYAGADWLSCPFWWGMASARLV